MENVLAGIKKRSTILLILILALGFGSIVCRLFYLQIIQGEELSQKAVDQQLSDTTVSAKRGSILDRNGNTLASSASVWKVILAPAYFENDKQRKYVSQELASILGLREEDVYELASNSNSYYQTVKRRIESDERDKILAFVDKLSQQYERLTNVIVLEEDFKRYYPYNDFAAAVIGFTGSDGQGLSGIEFQYDSYLTGTPGRIITENNGWGTTMPFEYQQKEDAHDGNSLVLTIDETVQHFLEKYLKQGIIDYKVVEGAVAVCVNVKTGEVLGMAVENSFDLNNPYEIADENAAKELEKLTGQAKDERMTELLAKQWRNKAISDTYYPGSVFKVITASAVLEENAGSLSSTYNCSGSYIPYEGEKAINCHNTAGHGTQTFAEALCNSCNPAFMQMGQALGMQKYWEYFQSFGFNSRTGIDLPGEGVGLFFAEPWGPVDLAIGSFGQGVSVTPIEMVTAVSAVANGGNLVKPYLVKQILDDKGNVVETNEPVIKRQVISKDTAEKIAEIMEKNATEGTAKNGYVAGYRIAGKTGTSEKIGNSRKPNVKDYIASYCGFAPADDPQIALLVYFDTPTGEAYYGSQVAAPVFAGIMSEICPYLGIETQYTEEELEYVDTVAGNYLSMTLEEAGQKAIQDGFEPFVCGEGNNVVAQVPQAGSKIPRGGRVVLFTTQNSTSETTIVPDMVGMSVEQVNETAAEYNINVSFSGSVEQEGILSYAQSINPRERVAPGTVVTVYFGNNDIDDTVM
ncbi:MAG: penicillin-binding transpeptidase domain-containing protein [Acutalibacteraceae bacterium]|nr:PASTA domain-containing protein [Clostridia bacterium]MEE3449320.1 penicillin-binding transpeptidase domain-containing protein [Acutalibacteraceae bacterium]